MTAVSLLLAVTALAFASTGGGKKKHHELENTFSLKKSSLYSGSVVSFRPQADNRVSLNAMLTYQRGNTTIILPYQYKVNIGPISNSFGTKSNLQFLGVRIQMPK
jgi:hypothetical protein